MPLDAEATPVILHLDMDAFFVSVEELSNPSLKGRPVVVGGRPGERGVVAAASYDARKFGVHSAMPLREAHRRCPQAVFLEGHPHKYLEYSRRIKAVLERFSPLVEMASIDEAYLDLTGTEKLLGPPLRGAHELHEAVSSATSLPCSIGIGTSRLVAKISSGLAKPNGILWVAPGAEAAYLAPLPLRRVPGVGRVTGAKLKRLGLETIGQVAGRDDDFLERHLGNTGPELARKARGLDAGAWFGPRVSDRNGPKSISHESTFKVDTTDPALIDATVAKLSQLVGRRLRERGLWSRTIQIKFRYEDFTTKTRARSLAEPTQLDTVILDTVRDLLRAHRDPGRAIRLLGVHAGNLVESPLCQPGLFDGDSRDKIAHALQAVDAVRDRFGESSLGLGSALRHGRRERVHENPVGLAGRGRRRQRRAPDRS